jgi:putative colanic acid biosysnthesis UDP-glucose lipid carrier transferase
MFKLEKVFQNDDTGYYLFINFIKSLVLLIAIYFFSILEKNSIYELLSFEIFKNSDYFLYSITISVSFFFISLYLKKKIYQKNFISFLKEDITNFILANVISFLIFFIFNINFEIHLHTLYLIVYLLIILAVLKLYFNNLYQKLINKNIIQKNVMLVGTYNEVQKILREKFDNIFVFKCCLITDFKNHNIKFLRSEFKFPIFKNDEDIRSILEYHSLGQIWIMNAKDKKNDKAFNKIIQFSVDTLDVNLKDNVNLKGDQLLGNKYKYEFFEYSRFYGINLFIKILIDKIFSIIFLIISSPILLIFSILIYIEDGFPILFTQNRTGWDGRRFKIYKLRSLKKIGFDKTKQVTKDDQRLLKIGKIVRRYSIDELPQFFNVLNGDMSIVGPRPHMVEHDIHYSNLFFNFLKRHKCNPGLTGWAQVNGLRGATPDPSVMKRRMEFDLWYLNNWTIWLDLYIIFKTFYALIKYKGD